MSPMTDSVEQICYLEYLISKYTSIQDCNPQNCNPQKQMLEKQYNSRTLLFTAPPLVTLEEQTVNQSDIYEGLQNK